jgi:hypothetical protein
MNYISFFIDELEKSKPDEAEYLKRPDHAVCLQHLYSWNQIFDRLKKKFQDKDGLTLTCLTITGSPDLAAEAAKRLKKEAYQCFESFIDLEKLKRKTIEVKIDQPLGALFGLSLMLGVYIMESDWVDEDLFYEELDEINAAYDFLVESAKNMDFNFSRN